MTTYEGLYHDVMSTLGLMHTTVKYPEVQFMRDLSKALNDFQFRTKIVESEKRLWRQSAFELGADILPHGGIREITDEDDNRFLMVSYEQNRRIFETYVEGRTADAADPASPRSRAGKPSYGITPASFDLERIPPDTGITPWNDSTRVCCIISNRVLPYPDRGDLWLQLYYYPNLELFHQYSKQWRAFFPLDSENFRQAFGESGVGDMMQPFERALCDWVVAEYYLREGDSRYKNYIERYHQAVGLGQRKSSYSQEMVVDYRGGAYSS